MTGVGWLDEAMSDRTRLRVAYLLIRPLWQIERAGTAAANLGDRIVWWGERARTQR